MLSILIPLYNQNAIPLVQRLHLQGVQLQIPFEIICFDDGSKSALNKKNQEINTLPYATFDVLEHNVGLSENRNLLANKAQYNYLIFIDGDSAIPSKNYLQNYCKLFPIEGIVYGGRKHPDNCPSPSQSFRWRYGKYKEDKNAEERLKRPYQSLIFNNTLITRKSFECIMFDKTINTYGHEDTMFAYRAQQHNINVYHIDNAIVHNEIDDNVVFLKKMHSSVQNLHTLYHKELIPNNFVKLLRYFVTIKRLRLAPICGFFYQTLEKSIHNNLTSHNPSLLFFDFFKIGYFCVLDTKK